MIDRIKNNSKVKRLKSTVRFIKEYRYASKVNKQKSKRYEIAKPKVINLLANDICNSKCKMCNIWQQKLDVQLTPQQLSDILKDDLFQEVRAVGITGGEPTLRTDIAEYYEACCKSLPSLQRMSIITNAIRKGEVIQRITDVYEVLKKYDKKFSIMVSLDGVGGVHDKHRGREGNFETAMAVIEHFRQKTDIPVSIGCTITKQNVWDVDELLDLMEEKQLYGRFRIGEFINRLYNNELTQEIRSFSEIEKYHLCCFFTRLLSFEKNTKFQRTYLSIISILKGGKRTIGCPYHENGVVLDSRGDLLYCAPKSKILGNTLQENATAVFYDNLDERERLLKEECESCIHDYHAEPTIEELREFAKPVVWKNLLSLGLTSQTIRFVKPKPLKFYLEEGKKIVFITGWYGTETVGDKAIIGAIFNHYLKQFSGDVHFIVSAIYPFITEQTLKELKVEATVIPTYDPEFINVAARADFTVMGGGPLMDTNALSIPLSAFKIAKKYGKNTVVFGCGLGPLYNKSFLKATKQILILSDQIKLRDYASIKWAKELTQRNDIEYIGDPAYHYIKIMDNEIEIQEKQPILACFLRNWGKDYKGEMSLKEYVDTKEAFEKKLALAIKELCREFNLTPHFYSMHTFSVGGDDRMFYRKFTKDYFQDLNYYIEKYPSSVEQIVRAMKTSSLNLCMRFHSVLFAHTLDTNFFAVDYTGGGKITGFLTDHNALDRMIPLKEIATNSSFSLVEKFVL